MNIALRVKWFTLVNKYNDKKNDVLVERKIVFVQFAPNGGIKARVKKSLLIEKLLLHNFLFLISFLVLYYEFFLGVYFGFRIKLILQAECFIDMFKEIPTLLLSFPTLNYNSFWLLFFVVPGYLFATFLLIRFFKKRMLPDLLLACLLFVTGWQRSSYILGFLGWYDTYEFTKINYLLSDLALALGPLLWFYVRSLIKPDFRFKQRDIWHFSPVIFVVVLRSGIWIYDMNQEGYAEVQNGILMEYFYIKYILPFQDVLGVVSQLLYYAFTIQAF